MDGQSASVLGARNTFGGKPCGPHQVSGVGKYWMVDPQAQAFTFLHRDGGLFHSVSPQGDLFCSKALEGFTLDLAEVRKTFCW